MGAEGGVEGGVGILRAQDSPGQQHMVCGIVSPLQPEICLGRCRCDRWRLRRFELKRLRDHDRVAHALLLLPRLPPPGCERAVDGRDEDTADHDPEQRRDRHGV